MPTLRTIDGQRGTALTLTPAGGGVGELVQGGGGCSSGEGTVGAGGTQGCRGSLQFTG